MLSQTYCFVQEDIRTRKKVKPYTSDGVFKKKLWFIREEDTKQIEKSKYKITLGFTLHIGQGEAKRPCQMVMRVSEDMSFLKAKRVLATIDQTVLAYLSGNKLI